MHDQQEEALSLVLEHFQAQHCKELRLLGLHHLDAAPDLVDCCHSLMRRSLSVIFFAVVMGKLEPR